MRDILLQASEAARYILEKTSVRPRIAVILGSGLGELADEVTDERIEIPYSEIPNFKIPTVAGHSGKMILGKIYDKDVIIMQGRLHYYEGYDMIDVTFPIRVFALLGVRELIVSNAAGGINKKFNPTDIMLITDHINVSGISPLRGKNEEGFGDRFPDMSEAYSMRLREIAKKATDFNEDDINLKDKIFGIKNDFNSKIELKEGVYAYMTGPQYETPAEIKMLETIGADAVGMSTVPEVIVANHIGIEVLGISCITNVTGAGKVQSHEEVIENADRAAQKLERLVMRIIRMM